ncbi:hypothetical protein GTO27_01850 [Candidatus Bathyarchaeota archaeon]|nr:hypothetical protein [Candidatus Bathyarchaeota archaeon]
MRLRYKFILFFVFLPIVFWVFLYALMNIITAEFGTRAEGLGYVGILVTAFSIFAVIVLISDQAQELFGE